MSAESLEPALHHTIGEPIGIIQQSQSQNATEKNKCITCGAQLKHQGKRKGPKLIRCDNCIQNDRNTAQASRPTQIFVSPLDGDIKFEVNDSNVIKMTPQAAKKTVTTVTKCTTCNGTGVVIVNSDNDNEIASTSVSNTATSTKIVTSRSSSSVSPQKIQQVQIETINQAPSPPPLTHHHPVQHHAPPANQSAQSLNDKPFSCNICNGKFSRYSSLWSHKKLHSGEKNYKCEICSSVFAKAVYLKNHMRIHSGYEWLNPINCEILLTQYYLSSIFREKPYKCNLCGMTFSQSVSTSISIYVLSNKFSSHNSLIWKIMSERILGKIFNNHFSSKYLLILSYFHREKPYVCQICDKGFARHATLWNHRRIHTGEKVWDANEIIFEIELIFIINSHTNVKDATLHSLKLLT